MARQEGQAYAVCTTQKGTIQHITGTLIGLEFIVGQTDKLRIHDQPIQSMCSQQEN